MMLSQKIRLVPNKEQEEFFLKSCGVARFAYNWALAEWQKRYQNNEKVTEGDLQKKMNAIKATEFPWMLDVSKNVPQDAIKNLGVAFRNFFRRVKKNENPGYPKFKKKGKCKDSFRPDNGSSSTADALDFDGKKVRIPRLGWVKTRSEVRFEGKIISGKISLTAGRWFLSICIDTNDIKHERKNHASCGIDLGIQHLATLDDGKVYDSSESLRKSLKKLKKLSRQHSKKQKGSKNKKKSAMKLANLHYRISCQRSDAIHKATTEIVLNNSFIAMEDLDVKAMMHKNKYAKYVADASMGEFVRQIDYKSKLYGSEVHFVDRYFASTKLCMECGKLHEMPLTQRTFKCDCNNIEIDRDVHAAQNILRKTTQKIEN